MLPIFLQFRSHWQNWTWLTHVPNCSVIYYTSVPIQCIIWLRFCRHCWNCKSEVDSFCFLISSWTQVSKTGFLKGNNFCRVAVSSYLRFAKSFFFSFTFFERMIGGKLMPKNKYFWCASFGFNRNVLGFIVCSSWWKNDAVIQFLFWNSFLTFHGRESLSISFTISIIVPLLCHYFQSVTYPITKQIMGLGGKKRGKWKWGLGESVSEEEREGRVTKKGSSLTCFRICSASFSDSLSSLETYFCVSQYVLVKQRPTTYHLIAMARTPTWKRWTILFCGLIETLVFSGSILGWSALNHMLKQEGIFEWVCDSNSNSSVVLPNPGSVGCPSQDRLLNLAYTLGTFFNGFTAFIWGFLLDKWGLRTVRLIIK